MSNVIIRSLAAADLDGLLSVERASFAAPWSRQAFDAELRNELAHYLVAAIYGEIVGYIGAWFIVDEAHITNVAVAQQYRRRNIGGRLVAALLDLAELAGITAVTLEVRRSNLAAQSLYVQHGFKIGGMRKNYYEDNHEDALIMWRREQ